MSHLEGCPLADSKSLHMRPGTLGGWEAVGGRRSSNFNLDFGSAIEETVSDLEGCDIADRCI